MSSLWGHWNYLLSSLKWVKWVISVCAHVWSWHPGRVFSQLDVKMSVDKEFPYLGNSKSQVLVFPVSPVSGAHSPPVPVRCKFKTSLRNRNLCVKGSDFCIDHSSALWRCVWQSVGRGEVNFFLRNIYVNEMTCGDCLHQRYLFPVNAVHFPIMHTLKSGEKTQHSWTST